MKVEKIKDKNQRNVSFLTVAFIILAGLAIMLQTATSNAAEKTILNIRVNGLKTDKQPVIIYVCNQQEFLKSPCRYNFITFARNENMTVKWRDAPIGEYAISLYHDEDNNGKLRTVLFIPKEGFGFSRIQGPVLSRPKFSAASFVIEAGKSNAIDIKMLY